MTLEKDRELLERTLEELDAINGEHDEHIQGVRQSLNFLLKVTSVALMAKPAATALHGRVEEVVSAANRLIYARG